MTEKRYMKGDSAVIRIPKEKFTSTGQINSQTFLKHTNALRVLGLLML